MPKWYFSLTSAAPSAIVCIMDKHSRHACLSANVIVGLNVVPRPELDCPPSAQTSLPVPRTASVHLSAHPINLQLATGAAALLPRSVRGATLHTHSAHKILPYRFLERLNSVSSSGYSRSHPIDTTPGFFFGGMVLHVLGVSNSTFTLLPSPAQFTLITK